MPVVHSIYATALFDAARARGVVDAVRRDLAEFMRALRDVPELDAALRNPQLDRRVRESILSDVTGDLDELVRNFLRVAVEKGRAAELDAIAREFEELYRREEGILNVELTTAYELREEERREILDQIERGAGRRVEATSKVDPELIGGLVLQAGSLRLDGSVRGRLNRLRRELASTSPLRD